jgi:hypothetical protein
VNKWQTLKSEYMHKSPFGNIRKDKCKLPNGIMIEDYFVNEYTDWMSLRDYIADNVEQLLRYSGGSFYKSVNGGNLDDGYS